MNKDLHQDLEIRYNKSLGMNKISNVLLLIALFFLVFPQTSYAYLDPGTGSYVLQVMAAAVFGGLFLLKSSWVNVKHFFRKFFGGKEKVSEKSQHKDT